jgi:prepilin-type N-terminal cleavage/methylation domain-containing protein
MNQKGYSLIEMMISMAVGVVILIGLYDVLDQNQKVYRAQQEVNTMTSQVRSAMDIMARTVRSAGNNRRALRLAPAVYIAETDEIRILSDLNKITTEMVIRTILLHQAQAMIKMKMEIYKLTIPMKMLLFSWMAIS